MTYKVLESADLSEKNERLVVKAPVNKVNLQVISEY